MLNFLVKNFCLFSMHSIIVNRLVLRKHLLSNNIIYSISLRLVEMSIAKEDYLIFPQSIKKSLLCLEVTNFIVIQHACRSSLFHFDKASDDRFAIELSSPRKAIVVFFLETDFILLECLQQMLREFRKRYISVIRIECFS